VSAQFLLLRAVYPDLPEHQETAIATCVRQNDYLKLVSSRLDPAAAASLRETARALGLEQDVWPTFNYEFLQVYNPDLAIPTRGESLYLTPNGLRPTPMEVEPETPVLIPEYVKASEHVEEARRIPKNESRQRLLRYLLGGGERAFEIEDIVLIPGILTELSALTDEGIAERRAELHKLYDRALEIWDIILNEVYTLKRFRHPQAACRLPGNPTRQQVRKRLTRLHPDTVDPRNEATEKFCTNCKAKRACLQFALDNKIKTGIWGGLSPRGRADLRRK